MHTLRCLRAAHRHAAEPRVCVTHARRHAALIATSPFIFVLCLAGFRRARREPTSAERERACLSQTVFVSFSNVLFRSSPLRPKTSSWNSWRMRESFHEPVWSPAAAATRTRGDGVRNLCAGGKTVRFPPVCSAVSVVARTHGQVVAGNSLPGFLRQADAPAPPSSVNRENGREGIPCRMRVCSPFLYHIPAFLFFLLLRVAASTTVTR